MKKILAHLTALAFFSLPVPAYAALSSDVVLEKTPDYLVKLEEKNSSSLIILEASQRPSYIGIHGGTAPLSLMRTSNGLLLAFTGQTGNDFILSMRNNASQHNKADLQDPSSLLTATPKKTQSSDDKSFTLNASSKASSQLEKTDTLNNPANKSDEEARAQEANHKLDENKTAEKNPSTELSASSACTSTKSLANKSDLGTDKVVPIEEKNTEEIKSKTNKASSQLEKTESSLAEKTVKTPPSQDKGLLVAEVNSEVPNKEVATNELANSKKDLEKNDHADEKSKPGSTDLNTLPAAFKKTQIINSSSVVFAHDAGFEYLDDSTMLPFGLNEMDKPKISIASIEKKISFKPLVLHDYRPIL